MFKRLMIGMLAVGMVAIFTVEAANAAVPRYRRSVDSVHTCPIEGLESICPGSVRDKLYGAELLDGIGQDACVTAGHLWKPEDTVTNQADGAVIIVAAGCYRPTCVLTGTLECFNSEDTCVESAPNEIFGITQVGSESVKDFIGDPKTATGVAAFQTEDVLQQCDYLLYDSANVKPDAVIGFTTYYSGTAGNGDELGRFIDVCPIFYKNDELEDQFNCTIAWQDFPNDPDLPVQDGDLPYLPCCGAVDLLNVTIAGEGNVTSDPVDIINCDENGGEGCSVYTSDDPTGGFNGCPEPEITLTATADEGWSFSEWTGPCTGDDLTDPTCTVTAAQGYGSVMATFVQLPIITVIIENGDANDRVRIFRPSELDYTDPANTDICTTDDSPCTIESLAFGAEVTFKKQGDSVTWSGLNCLGGDNSADTCTVILQEGESNTIYANFD